MDIICKCGHEADNHDDYGCISCAYKCEINEREVLHIYITEQQARLDTNRAQVAALIAERDALKAQKLELIKAIEAFLDCKFDCDKTARDVLGKVCDD
jgi:hypothetical protein